MDALNPFRTTGWQKAARVNCALLVVLSISLVGLSITALSYGFQSVLFLYSGDCSSGHATTINLLLHLLINVVSTLVVLNSPSREEIDRAHSKGYWLDIGVSSIRNVFRLSKFKLWCWTTVVLTSVPIHLFFNSVIFRTDYRGSNYRASLILPGIFPAGTYPCCSHYGTPVEFSEYKSRNSWTMKNISADASEAARWTKISIGECRQMFASKFGLTEYGNVILVANKPGGWIRDEMWKLQDDEAHFWDQYVPPEQPNHLFFHAQCVVNKLWLFPSWNSLHYKASDLQPSAFNLSVDYCLAQPVETTCQVGVSPILLLVTTVTVIAKTITAVVVTSVLSCAREVPLVTPGDAVASFITKPDAVTVGYCSMSRRDIRKAFESSSLSPSPEVRPWYGLRKRWGSAIPRSNWVMSYFLIAVGIGVCGGLTIQALTESRDIADAGFFPNNNSPTVTITLTFIQSVLLANSPQLLLTLCYFAYNNIYTHLHSAWEWARFGIGYFPLRVTDPKGEQLSTYRLQLSYRYRYYEGSLIDPSLPTDAAILVGYSPAALLTLLIIAIILALIPPIWSFFSRLPPNIVVPGCNSLALSAACHASKLSRVITKAINSDDSTLSAQSIFKLQKFGKPTCDLGGEYALLGDNGESYVDEGGCMTKDEIDLERVAQSRLRWGVIRMPSDWYRQHNLDPESAGHLGFGTVEDAVAAPLWGHLYA
ncbi:hypothetical protein F5Y01DRAFT_322260 [Xylaria sp. FL0043]|nr:hypothetical protein F5Y01DRAFT_322260 [Xylaria sp. FL0043]